MSSNYLNNLKEYINEELSASALYRELARIAPKIEERTLLNEMSQDEATHAQYFKKAYRTATGRSYEPEITTPEITGGFAENLRDRVLDEAGDYRKYGEQFYYTQNNDALKRDFFLAHLDENVHALYLLDMLSAYT